MKSTQLTNLRKKYIIDIQRKWNNIAFIKFGERFIPFGYNEYLGRGIMALEEEHNFIKSKI